VQVCSGKLKPLANQPSAYAVPAQSVNQVAIILIAIGARFHCANSLNYF
jgi:hypothetical protein